jgi:hypothetical protein
VGLTGLIVLSALAVLIGSWAATQEADQYVHANLDGAGRLNALLDGKLLPGLSSDATKVYAEICMAAVVRLDAKMQPPSGRQQLDTACLRQIEALAERSPVNSFLWFAQAQLAFQAHDFTALSDGLVQSVASGPNEYWIAARRFDLGERAFEHLLPKAVDAHEVNMAMLAGTAQGNRLLAARYVYVPEFRDRATAFMETQPANRQHIFLLNVEEFSKQRHVSP